VVLATGYSKAAAEAAQDFVVLRKPYEIADLSRAVASLITRARRGESADNLVSLRDARRSRGPKRDRPE
jgi:hypothetical protein